MPELPYVEKTRKKIHSRSLGKSIVDVTVSEDKIVFKVANHVFAKQLLGRRIVDTSRKGKYFWFKMDKGPCPLFHLGMTGCIKYMEDVKLNKKEEGSSDYESGAENEHGGNTKTQPEFTWPPPYWKFCFKFDDGTEFAFLDKRRLGKIYLLDDPVSCPPINKLGFDAFLEVPDDATFYKKVSSRSTPIKSLLLDQAFSAGVGNWIADEILYQSQIHPQRYTSTLSGEEVSRVRKNLISVVEVSTEANNVHSEFPADWLFHYRWSKRASNKEAPLTAKKEKISFCEVGGRTSAFVKEIQVLDKESKKKIKEAERRKKERQLKKSGKEKGKKKRKSKDEKSQNADTDSETDSDDGTYRLKKRKKSRESDTERRSSRRKSKSILKKSEISTDDEKEEKEEEDCKKKKNLKTSKSVNASEKEEKDDQNEKEDEKEKHSKKKNGRGRTGKDEKKKSKNEKISKKRKSTADLDSEEEEEEKEEREEEEEEKVTKTIKKLKTKVKEESDSEEAKEYSKKSKIEKEESDDSEGTNRSKKITTKAKDKSDNPKSSKKRRSAPNSTTKIEEPENDFQKPRWSF